MAKLYWRVKKKGKWTWVAVDPQVANMWKNFYSIHWPGEEEE